MWNYIHKYGKRLINVEINQCENNFILVHLVTKLEMG